MFRLIAPLLEHVLATALLNKEFRSWVRLECVLVQLDGLVELRERLEGMCRTKGW